MDTNNSVEERILIEAKRMFIQQGFENTKMSDIAVATGINRPTLHYYFRTKDIMFRAVFGSIVGPLVPKLEEFIGNDIPLMDKFGIILDAYFGLFIENPGLPKFIAGEIQRDINHLLDTVNSLKLEGYIKTISQLLKTEMEAGRIKKVEISFFFMTFYSQLIFPFISKELLLKLFIEDEAGFIYFIKDWKRHILEQIGKMLYD